MSDNNSNSRKFGAGKVLLCVILALIVSAGILAGLYFYGNSQEKPAALLESAPAAGESVTLYSHDTILTDEAAPAEPENESETSIEPVKDYGYNYKEIVYEEDGFLLASIQGKRYVGYIAVIDDPERVFLGTSGYFSASVAGKSVDEISNANNAMMAVNGGGFADAQGIGIGGLPTGVVIEDGVLRCSARAHSVGLDYDGKLHTGNYNGDEMMAMNMRWAISYGPTLIDDGEVLTSPNINEEPRTAIGQRVDGSIIILSIQGRQVAALGVTLTELAQIMDDYGAIEASNLDGGASSDMYFKGEFINTANSSGEPRPIPTAVLVSYANAEEVSE